MAGQLRSVRCMSAVERRYTNRRKNGKWPRRTVAAPGGADSLGANFRVDLPSPRWGASRAADVVDSRSFGVALVWRARSDAPYHPLLHGPHHSANTRAFFSRMRKVTGESGCANGPDHSTGMSRLSR